MFFISAKYSVYLHIFPNGRKYVGCTSNPVKERWDGGLGYSANKRMFYAILRYGWENIKHYVLCEGLDKETALATEAVLIKEQKTYRTSKGYNTRVNLGLIPGDFVIPRIERKRVYDDKPLSAEARYSKRLESHGWQSYKCKPVRLIETREIYPSATVAANNAGVSSKSISRAASIPGGASGVCGIYVEERGIYMFVPAHWEYVNTNIEEKDDKYD